MTVFLIFLFTVPSYSGISERCTQYEDSIKKHHFFYFGMEFPYWYSIAQIQKESACKHFGVYSYDGIGSYGLAQITPKFWSKTLAEIGIPEIESVEGNLKAQAYINLDAWKKLSNKDKQLWKALQWYNGGGWIIKELDKAERLGMNRNWVSAKYVCENCNSLGFSDCRSIKNCVINYDYSKYIYNEGQKYNKLGVKSKTYPYWEWETNN